MWDKMERKFGRFAIRHLMNYLIGGYILGYFFLLGQQITGTSYLSFMTLDPYQIIHGTPIPQIWRIITWVLIPPFGTGFLNFIFGVIMMIFYWQLGTVLERTWGTFRFNVFIWSGIIFTIIGAFILYGINIATGLTGQTLEAVSFMNSTAYSTNYINLSIFLAFALCYPDMRVMLYFIIPIRMKWLAIVYAVLTLIEFVQDGAAGRVAIIASLLSFFIFYMSTRESYHVSFRQAQRRHAFKKAAKNFQGNFSGHGGTKTEQKPRHKCCICGRTDISNPELTFRYCSKCNGNYEYCEDHLYNHIHVK